MARAAVSVATALALFVTSSASAQWVDANGLEFVSQEAFCRFHCSHTHVARAYRHLQATSECTSTKCSAFVSPPAPTQRRKRRALSEQQSYSFVGDANADTNTDASVHDVLASAQVANMTPTPTANLNDNKNVETVDFVTCQQQHNSDSALAVNHISLAVGDPTRSAFAGFHDAFFSAYDAMISSADASYDACKLQFFQDALLQDASLKTDQDVDQIRPMLVRLNAKHNELECLDEIREIWTSDDESLTPFLTRSDQGIASATVLLLHISKNTGERIVDRECVDSVVQLPAVLKLTPFARASVSLARSKATTGGPALDVQLAKGSAATADVAARLQQLIEAATGIKNAVSYRTEDPSSRAITLQELADFATWTKALAVILEDEAVEWVDLKTSILTGALAKGASLEQKLMETSFRSLREVEEAKRRLDAYVQDLVGVTEVRAKNITGSNIVVGVTDTGLYIDHDQFDQTSRAIYNEIDMDARKVVLYRAFGNRMDESEEVTCGHGTHVSGILAGSSMSKANTDLGIAHSARIAFMDIGKQSSSCRGEHGCKVSLETPGDVESLMKFQVDAGARIFSFSWGTGGNDYNAQSRDIDNYVYNNPEVLIIVAAGNSGYEGSQSISSPSGAKNVISVGASLNDAASFVKTPCASVLNKQTVASFSSIGPTLDGRLKPDLVAPGMTIESAQSLAPGDATKTANLCSLQGTSQSTPVVAGMAVLLYEWLRDGWWKHGVKDETYGMKTIPASLLKALILHSGEKLSRRLVAPSNGVTSCVAMENAALPLKSYPDFNQGYGKPTMENLVSFRDDQGAGVYFFPNSTEGSEPRVTEGEESKFTFVLKNGANLRVTIVWSDPAGSVGGKQALQNDLDLSVKIPGTDKVFYPLSGNGTRDSVNNVEMVEVSFEQIIQELESRNVEYDEEAGVTVEAVVFGLSVKAGARTGQPFALVASSSPYSVETAAASTASQPSFWQPWMTIGIIIGGTLVVLFAIAAGWRMRSSADDDEKAMPPPPMQARRPTPPGAAAPPRRAAQPPMNDTASYHGGPVRVPSGPPIQQPVPYNRPHRAPSNSRQNPQRQR